MAHRRATCIFQLQTVLTTQHCVATTGPHKAAFCPRECASLAHRAAYVAGMRHDTTQPDSGLPQQNAVAGTWRVHHGMLACQSVTHAAGGRSTIASKCVQHGAVCACKHVPAVWTCLNTLTAHAQSPRNASPLNTPPTARHSTGSPHAWRSMGRDSRAEWRARKWWPA